jgi:hypothetical protein
MMRRYQREPRPPLSRDEYEAMRLRVWLNIESRLQSAALYESTPALRQKDGPVYFDIDFTTLIN